jgi:hypothetical protein
MKKTISTFYKIPSNTFFYWGFNIDKEHRNEIKDYYSLSVDKKKSQDISIKINNKTYDAKLNFTVQKNSREVLRIMYKSNFELLKVLRDFAIYSYAATIDKKNKPKIKELIQFDFIPKDTFKLTLKGKQETDFDSMFRSMNDKNLFEYWRSNITPSNENKVRLFSDWSDDWVDKSNLSKYQRRSNVIYLLNNINEDKIYVGKADKLGPRLKTEERGSGLLNTYDRFMFFELNPEYSVLIESLEDFAIRFLASIFLNHVKVKGLNLNSLTLVNKSIKRKK